MLWKVGFVAAAVLAWAGSAAAWERPLFDFQTEFSAPGGTLRLEARCDAGEETLKCRAEGRGPSGRGFRAEGRFKTAPQTPAVPQPSHPAPNAPQWF